MTFRSPCLSLIFSVTLLVPAALPSAQPAGLEPVRSPFWSGTIRGKGRNEIIADKGIVVTVGADKTAYVCYDTDLMRLSLAWIGDFLDFGNTLTRIEWPPPPQVKGTPLFGTRPGPGWAKQSDFTDPRSQHQGPLPKDWTHYQGLCVNGDQVVLKYNVAEVEVLETPGFENVNGQPIFIRTLQFDKATSDQTLLLADGVEGTLATDFAGDSGPALVNLSGGKSLAIGGFGLPAGTRLETTRDGRLVLKLSKVPANRPFRLGFSADARPAGFLAMRAARLADLRDLTKGGTPHFPEPVVTQGARGTNEGPYVVDTLTEPFPNPWNARAFFGGFDFFSDGRAAICTFHGDVWVVSGIDDSLEKLTWRRYATGMFQPLGLKIVRDTVYVLGRDQITRLQDLNNDGEADCYENFNNDIIVTPNYHEFALDLHTDSQGDFYFAKGAPWEPDVTSPHQGCLIKVSKDGSRLEIIATGFRAPNGMTVGPNDVITVSDNQGHWMPSSKLNLIKKGGFYGMTPAAHRQLTLHHNGTNFVADPSDPETRARYKFKGWDADSPLPDGYDKPMCWLPMSMDNSSGGQVWVTSDKWGPLKDHPLFMSYGKCTLFEVMLEEVGGVTQGGMVQFPLKFYSGLMRGRVNPRDGQVYLCGLKGWQTSATKEGGFYRVRYTGKPVHMPSALHAAKNGIEITFTSSLDAKSAVDVENYSVEQWNYIWTGNYGSPEVSVSHPGEKKHDKLEVKAVQLSAGKETVFLEIPDLKPCDQMRIKFNIDAADGAPISQEIYNTIYQLGPEKKLAAN